MVNMISCADNADPSYSLNSDDDHDDDESYDDKEESDRDEVKEVRKMSSKDTTRILFWRVVVTLVLLMTAFAVTFATYTFLKQQEHENFKTAFDQFSRTVGNAAVDHQSIMLDNLRAFAQFYSESAQNANATWPFYILPHFELHAHAVRKQTGLELLTISQYIKDNDADKALEYVNATYQQWIYESHMFQFGNLDRLTPILYNPTFTILTPTGFAPDTVQRNPRTAMWLFSPPPREYSFINWDATNSFPDFIAGNIALSKLKNESTLTGVRPYAAATGYTEEDHNALHSALKYSNTSYPHTFISHPIHAIPGDYDSEIVATIGGGFAWDFALRFLLPEGVEGIMVETKNNCNQSFTYRITGPDAFFIGEGSQHEQKYENMRVHRSLSLHTHPNYTTTPGHCYYSMDIYPSTTFEDSYNSKTPEIFAIVVAFTFVLVAIVFFIYDIFVQVRNEKIIASAAKSNAIVTSLFPENIRERLIGNNEESSKRVIPYHLKSVLLDGIDGKAIQSADGEVNKTKPLAELFLDTTIIFADISGFTAWSSVREPSQVFLLLESVYGSFDKIAKRKRVFKVETVGDCYVAVAGLPDPRRDHAVVMARFARDIMINMHSLTKQLEVTLGPDTCELTLRIGIHSGPVIGGVLRGARSRFQLFGDTMNTTSRIESTGEPGRIHLSQETAELIIKAGKQNWVERRSQVVVAKGKGAMQTYWLSLSEERNSSNGQSERSVRDYSEIEKNHIDNLNDSSNESRTLRLINWNLEQLLFILKQVVAHRQTLSNSCDANNSFVFDDETEQISSLPLDEVQEIITLPKFDRLLCHNNKDPATVQIPDVVIEQLKMYITWIASMYRSNPFHNFDHASHVLMSVVKLMSRIVAPLDILDKNGSKKKSKVAATLHDHTYGITSDPLTQFACAISALIHDVDHTGVPNAQLVAEKTDTAIRYKERSVAEQNSLDLAWNTLMEPQYNELRATIFTNECERRRFRQLVINSVLATDIVDKDLKALRNARWEKAFHPQEMLQTDNPQDAVNRKATIVIEHLIQASDVSHTMQHWHVFRKWNQRLFEEMYAAYRAGRAAKDPAEFWYQGEIGFFDFYIIPLAKKLKDCGVFGVSSDEFLNYAKKNREEWEARGQEIVAEMIEVVTKNYKPDIGNKVVERRMEEQLYDV